MLGYVCCLSFISPHLSTASDDSLGMRCVVVDAQAERSAYPATVAFLPVSLDDLANAASVLIEIVVMLGPVISKSLISSTTQTSTSWADGMCQ